MLVYVVPLDPLDLDYALSCIRNVVCWSKGNYNKILHFPSSNLESKTSSTTAQINGFKESINLVIPSGSCSVQAVKGFFEFANSSLLVNVSYFFWNLCVDNLFYFLNPKRRNDIRLVWIQNNMFDKHQQWSDRSTFNYKSKGLAKINCMYLVTSSSKESFSWDNFPISNIWCLLHFGLLLPCQNVHCSDLQHQFPCIIFPVCFQLYVNAQFPEPWVCLGNWLTKRWRRLCRINGLVV